MRLGLQVGFGGLIGPELLHELRGFGFQLIRIQAHGDRPEYAAVPADLLKSMVQEIVDAGMEPLVIVRDAGQIEQIPPGIDIEIGNEPDNAVMGWREGNPKNAEAPSYVDMAMRAIPLAENRNPLWIGSPRGLHRDGFALLRKLPWARIPTWVGCSFHRYPVKNRGPLASENRHGPFGKHYTREDEVRELRRIVGQRRLGLSEVGYNALDYPTEGEVAKHMAWERQFWETQDIDFAVAYQINDGPDAGSTHPDDHFGFRRRGTLEWKPCLQSWCAAERRG